MVADSIIKEIISKSLDGNEINLWSIILNADIKDYFSILEIVKNYENKYLLYVKSALSSFNIDDDLYQKIIDINDSISIEELEKYVTSMEYYNNARVYLAKRNFVLDKFYMLFERKDIILKYQSLLNEYFTLINKEKVLKSQAKLLMIELDRYQKDSIIFSGLFFYKEIQNLKEKVQSLDLEIYDTNLKIKEAKNQLKSFVDNISDNFLKNMLVLNKDILLTLGYNNQINPFNNQMLDVTLKDILDFVYEQDIYYFIGCNINNIDFNVLNNVIEDIKKENRKLSSKMALAEGKKSYYQKNLSKESVDILNENIDLIKAILFLRKTKNIEGIPLINYIYLLHLLESIKGKKDCIRNNKALDKKLTIIK